MGSKKTEKLIQNKVEPFQIFDSKNQKLSQTVFGYLPDWVNITRSINEQYANIDKSKLILGVPYYGNHWETANLDENAEILRFINSPSYRDVKSGFDWNSKQWSDYFSNSFFSWQENNSHQIWYDSKQSLVEKYDFAISHNMKGIGIWALGYDGNRTELWYLINQKYGNGRSFSAHLEKKKSKCDYHGFSRNFTTDEILEIEENVNFVILQNFDISEKIITKSEAEQIFDISRIPKEDLGEEFSVRVVSVGDFDTCPCIGNHVKNTSEIGIFKIISTSFENEILRIRFKLIYENSAN